MSDFSSYAKNFKKLDNMKLNHYTFEYMVNVNPVQNYVLKLKRRIPPRKITSEEQLVEEI